MSMKRNSDFKLLIRPEDVEVCHPKRAYMMMKVTNILYKGEVYEVKCIAKDKTELTLHTNQSLKVNDKIGVR